MSSIHHHGVMPTATHDEAARENFCRNLSIHLETALRPKLRGIFERDIKPALTERLGRDPDFREIAKSMRQVAQNRFWYRLRTDNQDRMYATARDMIDRQRELLAAETRKLSGRLGSLTLDPSFQMPKYLTELDIHRKPGGYHTEAINDDVGSGAEYDRTIAVHNMGSQGPLNDDPAHSIAAWLKTTFPDFAPKRILDMGCTIGNNTLPFALAFPDAEVHGIDCAAPCLRYAHARANALGIVAHFHQMNAESTSFPDGHFDLIVSRILFHETSRSALSNIIRECRRLTSSGGVMLHSDAPQFDEFDAYQASLRDWDATANNEPFMLTVYSLPLEKMYADAGFPREATFRGYAPSLTFMARNPDPNATRSGGKYFFTGARA